ncbi:MAG: hypothetical protein K6T83_01280 [Alicyclobacillus sp.]|nr:hypothetical protein [Alicyclobacillus sp.]
MVTLQQLYEAAGGTAGATLLLAALEKRFQWIKPVVKWGEEHKDVVAAAVAEGEQLVGNLLHSPALATVKLELEHAKQQVEQSEIYKAATAVLHNVSVRVEQLTPETKNAVAVAIATQVHKLFGKTVTVAQVVGVIDEFQKLAEKVAPEPAVQAANQLVQPSATEANTEAQTVAQTPAQRTA